MERSVNCVNSLRAGVGYGPMTQTCTSMVASLDAIIHMARYIENMVNSSPDLGNVSVLLCVETTKPTSPKSTLNQGEESKKEVHVLWGPPDTKGCIQNKKAERSSSQPGQLQSQSELCSPTPSDGQSFNLDPISDLLASFRSLNSIPRGSSLHLKRSAPFARVRAARDARRKLDVQAAAGKASSSVAVVNDAPPVTPPVAGAAVPIAPRIVPAPESVPGTPASPADLDTSRVAYKIPDIIAARCISLIRDGVGVTTHLWPAPEYSFNELSSREVMTCVSRLMETETEKQSVERSRRATFPRDPDLPTEKLTPSKEDYRYRKLIPSFLQCGAFVELPIIRLSRKGRKNGYRVSDRKKVRLIIKKPSRNGKETNFALLCVLMAVNGERSTVYDMLYKMSDVGLSAKGCFILDRFTGKKDYEGRNCGKYDMSSKHNVPSLSNRTRTRCGGPVSCVVEPYETTKFLVRGTEGCEWVGVGAVMPHVGWLRGAVILEKSYVVRFSRVFQGSTETRFPVKSWMSGLVVWNREDIERVDLIAESGVVGTAILSDASVVHSKDTSYGLKNGRPGSMFSEEQKAHLREAVVVCDIQLSESVQANGVKYPYAEWYQGNVLEAFGKQHFSSEFVPRKLTGDTLSNITELLWSSSKISPRC